MPKKKKKDDAVNLQQVSNSAVQSAYNDIWEFTDF